MQYLIKSYQNRVFVQIVNIIICAILLLPNCRKIYAQKFRGGNGSGYATAFVANRNLTDGSTIGQFGGGRGMGYASIFIANNNLTAGSTIGRFGGGIGMGTDGLYAGIFKLSNCDDNLVWYGNQNTNWHNPANWDCGTAPTLSSMVSILANRPFQPTVSANSDIFSLSLQPDALLSIINSAILKVGQ